MPEYMIAEDNKELIGKFAEIKDNAHGYSYHLHGAKGKIEEVFSMLFLRFDEPVPLGSTAHIMKGVYLTAKAFNMIVPEGKALTDRHNQIDEMVGTIAQNVHWMLDAGIREGIITPEMVEEDNFKLTKMLMHDFLTTQPYKPFSEETKALFNQIRRYPGCQ